MNNKNYSYIMIITGSWYQRVVYGHTHTMILLLRCLRDSSTRRAKRKISFLRQTRNGSMSEPADHYSAV
jgi:hypothetical protein